MAPNFLVVDRSQLLLMPPSVADWLPADHLAWFMLDVVDELDLSELIAAYRPDGRGGAAYPPALMVALLFYAFCVGELSSRRIERRCVEDVAFRVLSANLRPDHATIARFRATHDGPLGRLFTQVLGLCERAGMVRPELVAVDGTRMGANASMAANRTAEQLARQVLDDAAAVDAAEDAEHGEANGSELPEVMAPDGRRRERLRKMLDDLQAEAAEKSYEEHLRRRSEQEAATGRRLRGPKPKPDAAGRKSRRVANTTDPDSRLMRTRNGYIQGYNAQAAVTADQVIVAASVTNAANDATSFTPLLDDARANLRQAGCTQQIRTVVADAGYFTTENASTPGVEVLIAPGKARNLDQISDAERLRSEVLGQVERGEITRAEAAERLGVGQERLRQLLKLRRKGTPESLTTAMAARLATPRAQKLYKKRAATVEPTFGQTKHNRGFRSFLRRGLQAVDSEWKLMAATHNLLKLWRFQNATT